MVGCALVLDRPGDTPSAALPIAIPLAVPFLIAEIATTASSPHAVNHDLRGGKIRSVPNGGLLCQPQRWSSNRRLQQDAVWVSHGLHEGSDTNT
jgi:hypothetical protein